MSQENKTTAVATFAGMKAKDVQAVLGNYSDQMAAVLPKHLSAERMIAMAATEITRNPAIARCSKASLVGAVLQASILGFQPVAALGYCYFVPYGNDVQFQIGYKGMLALARNCDGVKTVYAEVVRQGDKFEYTLGLHRDLIHEPKGDLNAEVTHAYAVAEFDNGGNVFVVLSRAEIERLRKRSPMQSGEPKGAWKTDYDAMAKAKALKQLAKYLPLSIDKVSNIATDGMVIKPENIENGHVKTEDITYEEVNETTGEPLEQPSQEAQAAVNKAAELAKAAAKKKTDSEEERLKAMDAAMEKEVGGKNLFGE